MLVDVGGSGLAPDALNAVALEIAAATRETDFTGWYRPSHTIGVVLTALNDADPSVVERALSDRIRGALATAFGSLIDPLDLRITFHIYPEHGGSGSGRPGWLPDHVFHRHSEARTQAQAAGNLLKRALDILGSSTALVALSPLFVSIAIAIKLTSPGPVLFKQTRIGRLGRPFTFLKFRSMHVDSDSSIHQQYVERLIRREIGDTGRGYKMNDDPRITPLGRWLRTTSLDELPQFLNVLRGEMSLVGPRPPIPYETENYAAWHRLRILEAKPGITGAWQVDGRSRTTFDEMVRMDLAYIRHRSLWLDLKILLRTPLAVFRGDGAF